MNSVLAFLNLGGQEMIIIFLIVLLLFGAKKLPELAKGVGKSLGEFKKARDEFETEITRSSKESYDRSERTDKPESGGPRLQEPAGKEPRES